jgi:alpha-L-fucosidase 2
VAKTLALAAACQRTLEIKGDKTTGWSTGWRVNLQARLLDGNAAYHTYRVLLRYVSPDGYRGPGRRTGGGTYPNLLDAHSPFQIDGNFGGCAGVMEMLVQSQYIDNNNTTATLLPALPEAWTESGSINGVCIRGGYKIDMAWKKGRIVKLTVHDCRPDRSASAKLTLRQNNKKWTIRTKPGQSKRLL